MVVVVPALCSTVGWKQYILERKTLARDGGKGTTKLDA